MTDVTLIVVKKLIKFKYLYKKLKIWIKIKSLWIELLYKDNDQSQYQNFHSKYWNKNFIKIEIIFFMLDLVQCPLMLSLSFTVEFPKFDVSPHLELINDTRFAKFSSKNCREN